MRGLRILFLRIRRACAVREIRQARAAGIRTGAMLREWSTQVDRYDTELARLGAQAGSAPTTAPPIGIEAAWADTNSALSGPPPAPFDERREDWGWIFRSALVAAALGLVLYAVTQWPPLP